MNEFSALGLAQPLQKAVAALGFTQPTPIQAQAIPPHLQGDTDLVGLAQTGTGKTAAFGLPLLQLIDPQANFTQALVLAPTRELCIQITKELEQFARFMPQIIIRPVYGGTDINRQIRSIKAGAHIIVATPGRLKDLQNRRVVDLMALQMLVLDEADEMLNMGFKPEIDHILRGTSPDKLTWLFSATMPDEVRRISEEYLQDPLELSVGQRNAANTDIDHQYLTVSRHDRYAALTRFLDGEAELFGLVFCRTRRDTKKLAKKLRKDGYHSDALHGDLTQKKRDKVMDKFRRRELRVLIATDVAARGIDVQDITHVFHYNIPDDLSFYTHRAGRTGRAGQKGISLVFTDGKDKRQLRQLERIIQARFSEASLPTVSASPKSPAPQQDQELETWIRAFREMPLHPKAEQEVQAINNWLEGLSKREILIRLGSLAFQNGAPQRKPASTSKPSNPKSTAPSTVEDDGKMVRLFINVGAMDLSDREEFVEVVCEHAEIKPAAIGQVNLQKRHTFFEVDRKVLNKVLSRFEHSTFDGRDIRVNRDNGPGNGTPRKKGGKAKKSRGKKGRRN